MSEKPELVSKVRCFGGWLETYRHPSKSTKTDMRFAIYLPPQAERGEKLPVLYWLSGLTCTEENFMAKSGAQRYAAEHGVVLVAPDTSPRGAGIEGEDDDWDFGTGAGFYVTATQPKWSANYNMYAYVTEELPALVEGAFPVDPGRRSISGHSMGGHGALVVALRNPERYRFVSAFSPICAPSACPWGQKAFSNYLGPDRGEWAKYDTCELIKGATKRIPLLVEQGEDDQFLREQLKPSALEEVCRERDYPLTLRRHAGYDHSYYFVGSFIGEHISRAAGG